MMGSNPRLGGNDDEKPVHAVYLDAFWIDKYEVTNAQYKKCVDWGYCVAPQKNSSTRDSYYGNPQYESYPVIVSWDQAKNFCTRAGKRLPTEAECEKAARGTGERIYPWGDTFDKNLVNSLHRGFGDTMPVGSFPNGASPYGVMDMAGNVSEWVADFYSSDYYNWTLATTLTNKSVTRLREGARN